MSKDLAAILSLAILLSFGQYTARFLRVAFPDAVITVHSFHVTPRAGWRASLPHIENVEGVLRDAKYIVWAIVGLLKFLEWTRVLG